MDKHRCAICDTEFDLDKAGLVGPRGVFVCGTECAKRSAKSHGHSYAVHDDSGDIIDTDVKPGEKIGLDLW